jgi:hypothetical protein
MVEAMVDEILPLRRHRRSDAGVRRWWATTRPGTRTPFITSR